MFIEREGVIILHLHPPQSAYMEAGVSVQAVWLLYTAATQSVSSVASQ